MALIFHNKLNFYQKEAFVLMNILTVNGVEKSFAECQIVYSIQNICFTGTVCTCKDGNVFSKQKISIQMISKIDQTKAAEFHYGKDNQANVRPLIVNKNVLNVYKRL